MNILLLQYKSRKYITQKPNHGREEIQRIKAAKPDIPHREAFSMASKNVSDVTNNLLLKRLIMAMSLCASCNMNRSGPSVILVAQLLFRPPPITVVVNPITPVIIYQSKVVCCLINSVSSSFQERVNCPRTENSKFCKQMEQKN